MTEISLIVTLNNQFSSPHLNSRIQYHDTDSIIYVHDQQLFNPHFGDYLGDLTGLQRIPHRGVEECISGVKITTVVLNRDEEHAKMTSFLKASGCDRQKHNPGVKWTLDGDARDMVDEIAGLKKINSSVMFVS